MSAMAEEGNSEGDGLEAEEEKKLDRRLLHYSSLFSLSLLAALSRLLKTSTPTRVKPLSPLL